MASLFVFWSLSVIELLVTFGAVGSCVSQLPAANGILLLNYKLNEAYSRYDTIHVTKVLRIVTFR